MEADYAKTLVQHAVSLRPGQDLFIRGPARLHDFALLVGEAAYKVGARFVHYRFPDPEELEQLIRLGSIDQIRHYLEGIDEFYVEVTKRGAASLCLMSDVTPILWYEQVKQECPENFRWYAEGMQAFSCRFNEYLRLRRFPHATCVVATDSWARRVFPDSGDPLDDMWSVISLACGNEEQTQIARGRIKALNALSIREIQITGGGNELTVELSEYARWTDATLKTRYGQVFRPNFPSREIFTVPDCRETRGRLVATQSFRLFDFSLVNDLVLEFHEGAISQYHASRGDDDFGHWIGIDPGAKRLGEIGLVGSDAPLYGIDRFFDSPILDENTASHIGIGQSISSALEQADTLSDVFLESIGCNHSAIHTDICFGSPEVSVIATKSAKGEVVLLDRDVWRV